VSLAISRESSFNTTETNRNQVLSTDFSKKKGKGPGA